jgi:subtilisin family serine protease
MKQFCLLFFFIVATEPTIMAQGSEYYYWYRGERQPLESKNDKWFVLLDYAHNPESLSRTLRISEDRISQIQKIRKKNRDTTHKSSNLPRDIYWTVVSGQEEEWAYSSLEILYHAPFFYSQSGKEMGLSHFFHVKLYKSEDIEFLRELAEIHGVDILGSSRFRPRWYTLACGRESSGNALEMANLFYETGLFSAAEPDLMVEFLLQSVNDPYFSDQWGLNNTGQYGGNPGSDIRALDAWAITEGSSDIVIAIVDQGLEMDHPDLPNIHPDSYDAAEDTSPSIGLYGIHGVAVAGIAGAGTNNTKGIAGIAPNSFLMSINHHFLLSVDYSSEIADGITFAWQNGADVLNNSWGHDDYQTQILDDAIEDAVTYGRDGLGAVFIVASGNFGDSISYPSSHPDAIAVGASSMCDERKSQSSCDGENWWSNYGTGLDIVAPGVLIPTTDMKGSDGYNPHLLVHPWYGGTKISSDYSNEDYTVWFHGTSAAAPHVSGVAALMLAINSNLTAVQVRHILHQSADKVGGYTYDGNGWNDEMGYGRLNAYKALINTIEYYGATLGIEKPQVTLPLWEDIAFHEDVYLASGSTLTIDAHETVTLSAASGTVTIGAPPPSTKVVGVGQGLVRAGLPHTDPEPEPRLEQFLLLPNYPNPFNPSTTIRYELPGNSDVRLEVYDMLGRRVALLVNEARQAGTHQAVFDASALSSGVYIYRLQAGGLVQTRKMLLIK